MPKHQVDELGPLPPGWEERVHSDGRIFFIDHSEWFLFLTFFQFRSYVLFDGVLRALIAFRYPHYTMGGPEILESQYCWRSE